MVMAGDDGRAARRPGLTPRPSGNDRVRVLEVVIEPRTREPEHTHRATSVMIVDEPARIRYYVGRALQFESPEHAGAPPAVRVSWMEPEGPHSVENIDERRYHAIRIELK
jgi:quercetin dioxygenase-like cupin family protein